MPQGLDRKKVGSKSSRTPLVSWRAAEGAENMGAFIKYIGQVTWFASRIPVTDLHPATGHPE
jgi:hypothetical protein